MSKKMKRNLNLYNLEKSISQTQMNSLKGGKTCGCGCAYRDSGGSSVAANCSANYTGGLGSPTPDIMCVLED